MEKKYINNLNDYVSYVCGVKDSLDYKSIENNPSMLLFRGHGDFRFKLIPSIDRFSRDDLCFYERNLVELTKIRLPHLFRNNMTPIEILSILQHYGIPTRLLDVTENPLVALYFACNTHMNQTGEIIVFIDRAGVNYKGAIVNGIADSYRINRASSYRLIDFLDAIMNQWYFTEFQHVVNKSFSNEQEKEDWIYNCCKSPIFVDAPQITIRQVNQASRFLLFPNSIYKWNNEYLFDSKLLKMSKDDDVIVGRILVKPEHKKSILDELNLFGIKSSTLFGDDIKVVCDDIKEEVKRYLYS